MKVWSKKQIQTFLELSKDSPYHTVYMVALTTGMRIGEILGLYWEDIDLEDGYIQIHRSIRWDKGMGLHTKEPKNEHSKRTISLPENTIEELLWYKENTILDKFVFHKVGSPLYPNDVSRKFQADVKKTDLPLIRFHDLRHTHATILLQMGVNPKVVAERLGHSTVVTTLDTYSHVMPSMQKEVAQKLNKLF